MIRILKRPQSDLRFGWTEWSGRKSTNLPITFPEPFAKTPAVTLGLVGLVVMQDSEAFGVEAQNITPIGFDLVLSISPTDSTHMLKFQWIATDS
jgi:hypothetical protein